MEILKSFRDMVVSKPSKPFIWTFILPWLPFCTSWLGDFSLYQLGFGTSTWIRALIDNGTHVAVAAVSWILSGALTTHWGSQLVKEALVCGVLSGLIDVDHFIAAKSLDIQKVKLLPGRPPFHCTTAMLLLNLGLFAFAAMESNSAILRLSWMFLVAIVTHHLRDAIRRGLWLWPWGSTRPLPLWQYAIAITVFPFLVRLGLHATDQTLKSIVFPQHFPHFDV